MDQLVDIEENAGGPRICRCNWMCELKYEQWGRDFFDGAVGRVQTASQKIPNQ